MQKNLLKELGKKIQLAVQEIFGDQTREIKSVDTWDGSASNYESTDDYCSACLIDVNPDGETKTQTMCMLPVRGPGDGDGVYVDKAVIAAAGGRGITQVKKPDNVDQETWDSAVKNAAGQLISAYEQMEKQAPNAVYELAGKTPPESEAEQRAISSSDMMYSVYEGLNEYFPEDEYGYHNFWVNDIYFDETGNPFVICSSEGKLYQAVITITDSAITVSKPQEVIVNFSPEGGEAGQSTEQTEETEDLQEMGISRTIPQVSTIMRQENGAYRWFGVSCSTVLNRVGFFDTRALFDKFAEFFEANPDHQVVRQFYHQGEGYRTGVVDFVSRDGNLLITSGLYDDTPLAKAEIAARTIDPTYWGDSIGFVGLAYEMADMGNGIFVPAYIDGYLDEVSTLPEHEAASHLTVQTVVSQEVSRMLEGKAFEAFVKLWGGDEAKAKEWLEANPEAMNRSIAKSGMLTLSRSQPTGQTQEDPKGQAHSEPAAETQLEPVLEIGETELRQISEFVTQGKAFSDLSATVGQIAQSLNALKESIEGIAPLSSRLLAVEENLSKLQRSEEQKRADWLSDIPARKRVSVSYRPSNPANQEANGAEQEQERGDGEERGSAALAKLPNYPYMKTGGLK